MHLRRKVRSYIDLLFRPGIECDALPVSLSVVSVWGGRRNDPDAHFSYVSSDLSMNGGAFDAGNYAWSIPSAPSDDGRYFEQTDQMKMPRLYEAHLGCVVLQSAQTST